MRLPFTADQFFQIFAEYHQRFAAIAVMFWLAAAVAVWTARRAPGSASRWLAGYLALLWLWNGVAYHAVLFTRINPAAWFFAALFVAQAVLLSAVAARNTRRFFTASGWRRDVGVGLALYALAYPALNVTLGHPYPGTPTFGVPCPTDVLTIGLLLTVGGRVPLSLSVIPTAWAAVGGSAALLLGVWPDFALLVAGALLLAAVIGTRQMMSV